MAKEKELALPEFMQKLTKSLKEKVEEFGNKCKEIRKAELNKSETCPLCGDFDDTGFCSCFNKSESLSKVSPPGMKEVPEKLKQKGYSAESAFKIAWAAYNKKHGKHGKKTKKNAMDPASYLPNPPAAPGASGGPGMMMSEDKSVKKFDEKQFPKLDDPQHGYRGAETGEQHPGMKEAGDYEPTLAGKKSKLPPTAKSMKKWETKKTEDYIDGRNDNDHEKRLKNFGGKNTKLPPKKLKNYDAPGSGGEAKSLTKDEMVVRATKAPKASVPKMSSPKLPKPPAAKKSLNDLHDAGVKSKMHVPAPTHPKRDFKARVSDTVDRIASGISGKKATGRMDMGVKTPSRPGPKPSADLPFGGKEFKLNPVFKSETNKTEPSFGGGNGDVSTMSPMRFSEEKCLICNKKNQICKCK